MIQNPTETSPLDPKSWHTISDHPKCSEVSERSRRTRAGPSSQIQPYSPVKQEVLFYVPLSPNHTLQSPAQRFRPSTSSEEPICLVDSAHPSDTIQRSIPRNAGINTHLSSRQKLRLTQHRSVSRDSRRNHLPRPVSLKRSWLSPVQDRHQFPSVSGGHSRIQSVTSYLTSVPQVTRVKKLSPGVELQPRPSMTLGLGSVRLSITRARLDPVLTQSCRLSNYQASIAGNTNELRISSHLNSIL